MSHPINTIIDEANGERLSDLIEELVVANQEISDARKGEEVARQSYIDGGGWSWGYAGQDHFDAIHEAQSKAQKVKDKIDAFNQAPPS